MQYGLRGLTATLAQGGDGCISRICSQQPSLHGGNYGRGGEIKWTVWHGGIAGAAEAVVGRGTSGSSLNYHLTLRGGCPKGSRHVSVRMMSSPVSPIQSAAAAPATPPSSCRAALLVQVGPYLLVCQTSQLPRCCDMKHVRLG